VVASATTVETGDLGGWSVVASASQNLGGLTVEVGMALLLEVTLKKDGDLLDFVDICRSA
jgi:hypothetical protein